jgi:hypothetical protein
MLAWPCLCRQTGANISGAGTCFACAAAWAFKNILAVKIAAILFYSAPGQYFCNMKYLFLPALLCACMGAAAQKTPARKPAGAAKPAILFPQSFMGHWKGTLYWYPTGKPDPQTVNMELHILPGDSAGQYTWQIVYGKVTDDNRPYVLKAVDSAKGHWVIDEKNGIMLDSYWVGQHFCGAFTVQGNTILDSYWIENGQLHVEFFSYKQTPLATTGKGTEDSPKVDSYRIGSYQKAVLMKMK